MCPGTFCARPPEAGWGGGGGEIRGGGGVRQGRAGARGSRTQVWFLGAGVHWTCPALVRGVQPVPARSRRVLLSYPQLPFPAPSTLLQSSGWDSLSHPPAQPPGGGAATWRQALRTAGSPCPSWSGNLRDPHSPPTPHPHPAPRPRRLSRTLLTVDREWVPLHVCLHHQ